MIGTHPRGRTLVALVLLAAAAVAASAMLGCNDLPVSVPGVSSGGEAPSYYAIPVPDERKPDVAETTGTVGDIDYTALRLRVGHLWFQADGETEIEADACDSGCAFADILLGDAVKVKHERMPDPDGAYYAREIEVENEEEDVEGPEDDQSETAGTVTAVDGGTFQVDGAWFWTDAATIIEVDACAAGPIAVGDPVKVEHSTVDTVGFGFYAFKVELKRECEEEEEEEEEEEQDDAAMAVK